MLSQQRTSVVLLACFAIACGGGSDGADAGRPDSGLNVPPGSCAQPGDVGNDIGVGTFCTPRGHECTPFPMAALCLAAAAPDDGQWFCTRTCTTDDQCGTDALCVGDSRGRACVPARCAPEPDDAGTPSDAGGVDSGAVDSGAVDDGGSLEDASVTDDAGA